VIYLAAVLVAVLFGVCFASLGLVAIAAKTLETANAAMASMRDNGLNDTQKEQAARRASVALMGSFLSITGRTGLAVAISLVPLAVFHAAGLARWSAVTHFLATWQGIVLACVCVALTALVRWKT
jgi:hypothetical protein